MGHGALDVVEIPDVRSANLPGSTREGEHPTVGRVFLAGTNDHLVLTRSDRLGYTPEPRGHVYRPSIDVSFESICRLWHGAAVCVLLTGMGSDGAVGLKALRDRSHLFHGARDVSQTEHVG
jgi:chemotaxis response regulator CheB